MRQFVSLVAFSVVISLVLAGCAAGSTPAASTPASAPKAAAATKAPEAPVAATKAAETGSKAAAFPAKGRTVTIIVPYAAGGPSDVSTRLIAPMLEKELGVTVQVQNVTGAGGQVGWTQLARSAPDGYTLAHIDTPGMLATYLDETRGTAFNRDSFVPVTAHLVEKTAFAVKADSPFKTLKDMVEAAKAKPGQVKLGRTGVMSLNHFTALLLENTAKVQFAQVNFDGGAENIAALLGGHTDAMSGTVSDFKERAGDGSIRVLAVLGKERSPFLPNVPTTEEQGYTIVNDAVRYYCVPKGTPQETVDVLTAAFKKIMADPELATRAKAMGHQLAPWQSTKQVTDTWLADESKVKELIQLGRQQLK